MESEFEWTNANQKAPFFEFPTQALAMGTLKTGFHRNSEIKLPKAGRVLGSHNSCKENLKPEPKTGPHGNFEIKLPKAGIVLGLGSS